MSESRKNILRNFNRGTRTGKWADLAPFPGPDTRDYRQEGINNAVGLVGLTGATASVIPSTIEVLSNIPKIIPKMIKGQPYQYRVMPGSFNWIGQKTGLNKNPMYQIGGIGWGGFQNTAARMGLRQADDLMWAARQQKWRQDMAAIQRYEKKHGPDAVPNPKNPNPSVNPQQLKDLAQVNKQLQDPRWFDAHQKLHDTHRMVTKGVKAPVVGGGLRDAAIDIGLGLDRANRNIKKNSQEYN